MVNAFYAEGVISHSPGLPERSGGYPGKAIHWIFNPEGVASHASRRCNPFGVGAIAFATQGSLVSRCDTDGNPGLCDPNAFGVKQEASVIACEKSVTALPNGKRGKNPTPLEFGAIFNSAHIPSPARRRGIIGA